MTSAMHSPEHLFPEGLGATEGTTLGCISQSEQIHLCSVKTNLQAIYEPREMSALPDSIGWVTVADSALAIQ